MTASLFLLPNATFFVELAIFLLILAFIGKKVVPVITKNIADRQAEIGASLEAAAKAQQEAAAADDARKQLIEEARSQAREIVATAQRTADQVTAEMHTKGQAEYDRIVANSAHEVAVARQAAVEQAATRMGEIVLDVVEKIVAREVNAESHRDLIDEAVATLRAEAGAQTQGAQ